MNPLKKVSNLMSNPVVDKYINQYAQIAVLHPETDKMQKHIQNQPLPRVDFAIPNQNSD